MKVRLTKSQNDGDLPAGHEIEHPNAHFLIRLGVAEAIDDEAKAKHESFLDQQQKKREKFERFRAERMELAREKRKK